MSYVIPRHGGYREGAGRRPRAQLEDDTDAPEDGGTRQRYDEAKTAEMEYKAALKGLEYRTRAGELVERSAVQQAAATAMQMFVQAARGMGDLLERRGVPPAVCEQVSVMVDEQLAALAEEMRKMEQMGREA